jgi:hypothetical protein
MRFRPVIVGFLTLLLTGCATDRLDQAKVADIKKVAVMSIIGDQLTMTEVAMTAFGNDHEYSDISAWGIDPHVVDLVSGQLKNRLQVVPVSYATADFPQDGITNLIGGGIDYWAPLGERIRDKVATQPNAKDVDAYLVVVKGQSYVEQSNQVAIGLGVARRFALTTHRYYVHALFDLVLIDGHSFKPLRDVSYQLPNLSAWDSYPALRGPYMPADESYWADSYAALSPEIREQIHRDLLNMLDRSLPDYVQRSGLLQ